MNSMPNLSLIARVCCADINFERLVEVLSFPGYVTDVNPEAGIGFGRVAMDKARQDDFDALFDILMPSRRNTINLQSIATDEGGQPGAFTYALFNSKVIGYEDMKKILVEMNRRGY